MQIDLGSQAIHLFVKECPLRGSKTNKHNLTMVEKAHTHRIWCCLLFVSMFFQQRGRVEGFVSARTIFSRMNIMRNLRSVEQDGLFMRLGLTKKSFYQN